MRQRVSLQNLMEMDSTRMAYVLAVLVATVNFGLGSSHAVEQDDWWNHQMAKSYNRSLLAQHPDPIAEVHRFNKHVNRSLEGSSNKRRALRDKSVPPGQCITENPIDNCWRCRPDWAENRKRLADCALGFGRNTTGGKDGEIYVVTDHGDDDLVTPKPGTLRFAVLQAEPLWIIFSKDMNIRLIGELLITSNKTIDGRGARIEIAHGAGLTIRFAHNVIIHNIKIHNIVQMQGGLMRESADHVGLRQPDDGDGLSIFASSNIWIDHLSISLCTDGLLDIVQASTAITISNSHFAKHDHVMLFGGSDTYQEDKVMQVTVAFNNFGKGLIQRMPRCRWGFFHVVNNDYTHWEMYAIGGTQNPTIISQGNRFTAPPDPRSKQVTMRNNIPDKEWVNWRWRSEEDLMLNGAFFIESGTPLDKPPNEQDFIKCQTGNSVGKLTRFTGHLKCKAGEKC